MNLNEFKLTKKNATLCNFLLTLWASLVAGGGSVLFDGGTPPRVLSYLASAVVSTGRRLDLLAPYS